MKKYLPGEAIPSERKMAGSLWCEPYDRKRAVSKLVEEGYLVCKLAPERMLHKEIRKRSIWIIQMKQEIPASQRRSVRVEWR